MRREMAVSDLKPPIFESSQGAFKVILYNETLSYNKDVITDEAVIAFCAVPRSREELAQEFGFSTPTYFLKNHVKPLVEQGKLALTLLDAPKSKNQKYVAIKR
ncbi:MAG: hypothetical protein FIA99_10915 [Ruminiclostridium sp.]|nr:hypothetical protein [Ruminiclostridium sp.]